MKSEISNPYGYLPKEDLRRLTGTISAEDFEYLFMQAFPRHGAMNNILQTLVHKFAEECRKAEIPPYYTSQNEETANKILSNLNLYADIRHTQYL